MSEMTQEEALRQADALVSRELHETETRCTMLAEFMSDCERNRLRTAAYIDAVCELRSLHDHRRVLLRRRSLIQEALDCPVGERPARVPLTSPTGAHRPRTQVQVQVQARAGRRLS